jgi:hypothetical protein
LGSAPCSKNIGDGDIINQMAPFQKKEKQIVGSHCSNLFLKIGLGGSS